MKSPGRIPLVYKRVAGLTTPSITTAGAEVVKTGEKALPRVVPPIEAAL
nr:hypothetical protein [Tanacetum cinerariifolium]